MKTISVVCEKGGVGKTVIAKELYEAAIRRGYRASLYALDGQYESRSVKDPDPEIVIIDTAGSLTDSLREIVTESDLIVIPTRPTPNDVEPFTRTVGIVQSITDDDDPIMVVVNGCNRYKMAQSFLDWATKKDWASNLVTIPQSEQIVQAQPEQSVLDLGRTTPVAKAIETMADKAFELVGIK